MIFEPTKIEIIKLERSNEEVSWVCNTLRYRNDFFIFFSRSIGRSGDVAYSRSIGRSGDVAYVRDGFFRGVFGDYVRVGKYIFIKIGKENFYA